MAGRQSGVGQPYDGYWGYVMGGFAVALAVETFVFIFAGFDVQTWQVGFIAIQAAAMGVLGMLPPSWRVRVQIKEEELVGLQSEIGDVERRVKRLEVGNEAPNGAVDEKLDVLEQLMKGKFK